MNSDDSRRQCIMPIWWISPYQPMQGDIVNTIIAFLTILF
jgi:hypothetical protein